MGDVLHRDARTGTAPTFAGAARSTERAPADPRSRRATRPGAPHTGAADGRMRTPNRPHCTHHIHTQRRGVAIDHTGHNGGGQHDPCMPPHGRRVVRRRSRSDHASLRFVPHATHIAPNQPVVHSHTFLRSPPVEGRAKALAGGAWCGWVACISRAGGLPISSSEAMVRVDHRPRPSRRPTRGIGGSV